MKKRRGGLALVSDGKVHLSFQQQRQDAKRLESDDFAAYVRCAHEVDQAGKNQQAFLGYVANKYGMKESDMITKDGTLIRVTRGEKAPEEK